MRDKLSEPKKELKPAVLNKKYYKRDQEERRNKMLMIKQIC